MDESGENWPDIPPELCLMIRRRFNSNIDILRFRSICKSWRSSLYPPYIPSSRIIITPFAKRRLTQSTIYRLEPSHLAVTVPSSYFFKAWLIKVEESEYGRLRLLNPFTNGRFLSSHMRWYSSVSFPNRLDMLNFRFVELVKMCSLSLNGSGGGFHPLESGKVVAFPYFAWTDLGKFMLFSVHKDGKLGFTKIGYDAWTPFVDGNNSSYYDDIIVFKGGLYVVDRCGAIYLIDCSSFKLVQFSPPFCSLVDNSKKHLVESCGSLFVVDMCFEGDPNNLVGRTYDVLGLRVYKLEDGWGKWLEVNNLDGRAFVLSKDCNFSLLACEYQGCEGDCIYFCDGGSVSMFNVRTSTFNYPMVFWPCPTLFDLCFFPKRKHCPKLDECLDWSIFPPELCPIIVKHLDSKIDFFRFRSICKSWRSSVSPSCTVSPRLSSMITSPFGKRKLTCTTIYRLALSDPSVTFPNYFFSKAWLIKVEDPKYTCLVLLNLFTNDRLSSSSAFLSFSTKEFNLFNFRFVELMKTYSISVHDSPGQSFHALESRKVVAFPNFAWTKIEDCMFFSVHRDGRLGFSKIGDKEWTLVDDRNLYYDDIIVRKGQLYVVDRWGIISWIDCSSLKLVQYSPPFGVMVDNIKKHLVESCGSLYVVEMYFEGDPNNLEGKSYIVLGLKVYKLDEELCRWLDVKNLGNRAFVLSKDCNFSLSAHDYHGCERNCVYFYDKGNVSMFNLSASTFNTPKVFWPCPSLFDLHFVTGKRC